MNRRQKKKIIERMNRKITYCAKCTDYSNIRKYARYYQELVTVKEREVGLYPNKRRWKTITKECLKNWDRRRNKDVEKW